jgi:hypothetical protein
MKPKELPIPPAVLSDQVARELLRAWDAHEMLHVSMPTAVWDDPAECGIFLVDLAKHVARAYHLADGRPIDETLARIKEGFDAEWDGATDEPTGHLID